MTLCTLCGENEAPEPLSIEDDPLCPECIRALLQKIAEDSMGELEVVKLDEEYDAVQHPFSTPEQV